MLPFHRGDDGHIRSDSAIAGVKCGDDRLGFSGRPKGEILERGRGYHGCVQNVRLSLRWRCTRTILDRHAQCPIEGS